MSKKAKVRQLFFKKVILAEYSDRFSTSDDIAFGQGSINLTIWSKLQ